MANLAWAEGLEQMRKQIALLGEAWPVVAFRFSGTLEEPKTLKLVGVHLQGTFENRSGELSEAFDPPTVLEGFMSSLQLQNLLAVWRDGKEFRFGDWAIYPPIISSLEWSPDLPASWLWNPLLFPPPSTGQFRFHRLSGGGAIDQTWREQVSAAAASVGMTPQAWSQAYLGLMWDASASVFMGILPIPASMDSRYDLDTQNLVTEFRFKRPLSAAGLWVRVSPGEFRASLAKLPMLDESDDKDGWLVGRRVDEVAPKHEEINVWGGREASSQPFDWHRSVRLSEKATIEGSLRAFLGTWYGLAGKTPGALVSAAVQGATGRSQHQLVESAAELLILNSMAAMGCSVFFGPKPLDTRGIDCMAFDRANRKAYPISVTIGNDIAEKARKWLEVREEVLSAVEEHWSVHPVIVTAQPVGNILTTDLRSTTEAGVLVLTAENLSSLSDEPPDIRPFWNAINRNPS